jgi:hypothetical protein
MATARLTVIPTPVTGEQADQIIVDLKIVTAAFHHNNVVVMWCIVLNAYNAQEQIP